MPTTDTGSFRTLLANHDEVDSQLSYLIFNCNWQKRLLVSRVPRAKFESEKLVIWRHCAVGALAAARCSQDMLLESIKDC
eukprot:scaffold14539_cov79-Skeletonema_marinoi.AAC.3